MISRDHQGADFSTKQEISTENGTSNSKASSSSTTTASWSRFKDPRIVRVSKAFGGKDRHSKVCTVRGLRDRRVRLSVPTAIQLYDLQDRLGLNQPSKVVDWLLNVAKHEIDGLPPLQIPQGMLNPLLASSHHEFVNAEKHDLKMSEKNDDDDDDERESWTRSTDQEDQRQFSTLDHDQFLSRQSNNNPYNSSSFVRWDPSNLTLSHQPQLISLGLSADHHEDLQSFSLVQLPSALSVYQHGIINTQPYFPAQIPTSQPSAFHASSDQPLRPFHFSMAADLLPSQNNDLDEQNKRD